MQAEELRDLVLGVLEDLKGIEITQLEVKSLTTITDYMIICTGRSTTHIKALADNVVKKAKEAKVKFIRMEGEKESEWILVDLADVVVHIMLPNVRKFYSLEDLWEPLKELRGQSKPDAD